MGLRLEEFLGAARSAVEHDRYDEAEALLRKAIVETRDLPPPDSRRIQAFEELAEVLERLGRYGESGPLRKECFEVRRQALGDQHPEAGRSAWRLARVSMSLRQAEQARGPCEWAFKVLEANPAVPREEVAEVARDLAVIYTFIGRNNEAELQFQHCLRLQRDSHGPDHLELAKTSGMLAELLHMDGRDHQAEALLRQALAIQESQLGPDHPSLANTLNHLAMVRNILGSPIEAIRFLERALEIERQARSPSLANTLHSLGIIYESVGDSNRAIGVFNRMVQFVESLHGYESSELLGPLRNLASACERAGINDHAISHLERIAALLERGFGPDHPEVGACLNDIAILQMKQGDLVKAESNLRRALEVRERALGRFHPDVAETLYNLGSALFQMKRGAKAIPVLSRALSICRDQLGREHASTRQTEELLKVVMGVSDTKLMTSSRLLGRMTSEAFPAPVLPDDSSDDAIPSESSAEAPRAPREVTQNGVRRIFTILCNLAACDGAIQRVERKVLDNFCARFAVSDNEADQLEFEGIRGQGLRVGKNPAERALLLKYMLEVIASDAFLAPQERVRLYKFGASAGYTQQRLDEELQKLF